MHRGLLVLALAAGLSGCLSGPLIQAEVTRGVYVGRQPTSAPDYDLLKARGVRTILSLQAMPWDVVPESVAAQRAGLAFVNVPMLAVPWPPPSEARIRRVLTTMADPARQPVFVHCRLGTDRAAMVTGLYRVYYLGWSPQEAWARMLDVHFQVHGLYGYGAYFWKHTERPDWAIATTSGNRR
ncbi:MAG TPA: hypothetical protein VFB36_06380 [Nevskiaceae bacterium]|nr:hypothetical protein [Nevskiaceae bacterium]